MESNYKLSGEWFCYRFLSNLDTTVIEEPQGYSKENMQRIATDIEKTYGGNTGEQKGREAEYYIYYE